MNINIKHVSMILMSIVGVDMLFSIFYITVILLYENQKS